MSRMSAPRNCSISWRPAYSGHRPEIRDTSSTSFRGRTIMRLPKRRQEKYLRLPCENADHLHHWIEGYANLRVPRVSVCPHHDAPFDYVRKAYFQESTDLIVWAPRGGGKTRLAALVTLLDLLHKPGCDIRILGGSLEQSLKMWEHLNPDIRNLTMHYVKDRAKLRMRRVSFKNDSTAAVLTQSECAVRGLRIQKLRCDEVDLFKPEIWQAAQFVTRSKKSFHVPLTLNFAGPEDAKRLLGEAD